MSSFVPPGYITCEQALVEIYKEHFPDYQLPSIQNFKDALRHELPSKLDQPTSPVEKGLVQVVHHLLNELYKEQRAAFYVTRYGEHVIEPHRFLEERAALMLIEGRVAWSVTGYSLSDNPRIYISERQEPVEKGEQDEQCLSGLDVRRGGRPETGRDAALVYWGMFPDGHKESGLDWTNALYAVNGQLVHLGLVEVGMTTLKEHVAKFDLTRR